jgi:general secretion pathway protein A
VLIIDEAQNLSVDVLEQMRLLTNLETNQRKLLQIILLGQPELGRMLERPDLRQLAQRIVARYHLGPLNKIEVAAYIRHRLDVSGVAAGTRQLFPGSLVGPIFRLSGGVPRLINVLCDRALLGTYVQGKERVDSTTLKQAATEVFPPPQADRQGRKKLLAWSAALVLAVLAVAWPIHQQEQPLFAAGKPAPAAVAAAPAGNLPKVAEPLPEVLVWSGEEPRPESQRLAFAALYKAWGAEYPGTSACQAVTGPGLSCRTARGTLGELRQMNRPVVLTLRDADKRQPVFYATLLKLDRQKATFAIGSKTTTVAIAALADQWSGQYSVLWRRPPEPHGQFRQGERGPAVQWVSRQLALFEGAGASADADPAFDAALVRRIKHFQLAQDLDADGAVGPKTLMRLTGVGDAAAPKLSAGEK